MADNNFLSSLLNYGQSLAQHYLPVQQAPQVGQGMLSNIYSTIDSTKRKLSDFVQNPVESTRQFISNQNEDSGKQLGLLHQSFTGADGRPTISPQTPQAQAAHNELTDGMTAAMMGATVWHGSPHKFNAFDSGKIGTGEGAQAYGHGLYLADAPDVAKSYSTAGIDKFDPMFVSQARMAATDSTWGATAGEKEASIRRTAGDKAGDYLRDNYEKLRNQSGSLYKVDLPDEHIAKMLDWDKPLSAQPDVLKMLTPDWQGGLAKATPFTGNAEITGQQLYNEMRQSAGNSATGPNQVKATEWLKRLNIPGIKYLDGGSRATGGTSNYVVFPGNEHLLSIQERNGVPLKSLLNK